MGNGKKDLLGGVLSLRHPMKKGLQRTLSFCCFFVYPTLSLNFFVLLLMYLIPIVLSHDN